MIIKTTSTNGRVALWERHPLHPNGEVFVVNNGKPYEAGETPRVKTMLGNGLFVLVDDNQAVVDATTSAKKLADANGIDLATVTGTGANGRITKADVEALL